MSDKGLWIPPAIWCKGGLSLVDKTILATVHSFYANDREFYQTNATIAQDLGISESTVKRAMQNLVSLGCISVKAFDGRKRKIELTKQVQNELAGRSKRPISKVKKTQQKGQNEPAGRSKRPTKNNTTSNSKNNSNKGASKDKPELLMPFEDFEEIWQQWCEYKWEQHRFKYKSHKSEQAALHYLQNLSKHDRQTAIEIIGYSIANGYKGLFEQRGNPNKAKQPSADEFADYIRNGNV